MMGGTKWYRHLAHVTILLAGVIATMTLQGCSSGSKMILSKRLPSDRSKVNAYNNVVGVAIREQVRSSDFLMREYWDMEIEKLQLDTTKIHFKYVIRFHRTIGDNSPGDTRTGEIKQPWKDLHFRYRDEKSPMGGRSISVDLTMTTPDPEGRDSGENPHWFSMRTFGNIGELTDEAKRIKARELVQALRILGVKPIQSGSGVVFE